jgi:hypothetical protein
MANNCSSEPELMEMDTSDVCVWNLRESDYQGFAEWKSYAEEIINICNDVMCQRFTTREVPETPKVKLTDLINGIREKKEKNLIELHDYLITKLVADSPPDRMPALASYYTTLNDMVPDLRIGYEYIKGRNAHIICDYMDYGEWLNVAFEHFEQKKWSGTIMGTFDEWLKQNVGIKGSYARMLRDVAKRFGKYRKIHQLGIPFRALYDSIKDIMSMLQENKEIEEFWRGRLNC